MKKRREKSARKLLWWHRRPDAKTSERRWTREDAAMVVGVLKRAGYDMHVDPDDPVPDSAEGSHGA